MPRPRSFDEDEVLEAITRTFWERGFANTSLGDLEAATGLGRQSLYCAFGDKHTLFLRALERYATYGEQLMPSRACNVGAPLEQVHHMLRSTIDQSMAPDSPRACLTVQAMTEFGPGDSDVQARCREDTVRIEQWIRRLVDRAEREGVLAPGLTPADVTTLIMGQYYGIPVLVRAGVPVEQIQASVDLLMRQLTN